MLIWLSLGVEVKAAWAYPLEALAMLCHKIVTLRPLLLNNGQAFVPINQYWSTTVLKGRLIKWRPFGTGVVQLSPQAFLS